jgi:hypothetical protein
MRHPRVPRKSVALTYCNWDNLQKDDAHRLVPLNTHRLLLTSVLLAAKLTDDDYFNNAYYAKVGALHLGPPSEWLRDADLTNYKPEKHRLGSVT